MDRPLQEELQGNPAEQEDQVDRGEIRAGAPRSRGVQAGEPDLRVAQQQEDQPVHRGDPGLKIEHHHELQVTLPVLNEISHRAVYINYDVVHFFLLGKGLRPLTDIHISKVAVQIYKFS